MTSLPRTFMLTYLRHSGMMLHLHQLCKSGQLNSHATSPEIDGVHAMVMDDGCLTVNTGGNAGGIFQCRGVASFRHHELGTSKVSARWVPRLLTPDQKHTRLNLALVKADPAAFQDCFLTQDEFWLHHFEPDQMAVHAVETSVFCPTKKTKVVSLAGKVMASVFWDAMFIDFHQKGRIINGDNDADKGVLSG